MLKSLQKISEALGDWKAPDDWYKRAIKEKNEWDAYVEKQSGPTNQEDTLLCSRRRCSLQKFRSMTLW